MIERNRLSVYDLGSTNGIFVKGKRISSAILNGGAKVLFGQRTMAKFVLEDPLDRAYQESLWSSCTRDGLTGIANRDYLKKRIVAASSFAKRHQLAYSLILLKLDNLDEINRTFGMQVGDQSLVVVVRIISDIIRAEDVFSRFDRDEFAILSTGCDLNGAEAIAKRICEEVTEKRVTVPESTDTAQIFLSAGIATVFNKPDLTTPKLLSAVEENLEKARKTRDQPIRVFASHVA